MSEAVRAQGETSWAVEIGKVLSVMPAEDATITTVGNSIVTWESLAVALVGLEIEAAQGQELGNLDSFVASLR